MNFEITGLDHVQLAMPAGGEAVAEAFYAEPMARRGGCWFSSGTAAVHLGVDADFRPARKAHPALRVRNLAALAAHLGAAGVAVRPNPDQPEGAGCYVDDPFGNRIELIDVT
jgi:catechol 2,3-dioxygenase-like lactoylglutathione lyase family enzyme